VAFQPRERRKGGEPDLIEPRGLKSNSTKTGTGESMRDQTMKRTAIAAFCTGALLTAAACLAQQWPLKPVRVVIHQPAGGPTDLVPRAMFNQMSPKLGQPFVVENRPGAGGIVGLDACAKAAADGYNFCMTNNGFPTLPLANPKLPFDTQKDFIGVALFGVLETLIVVNANVPATSLRELLDLARAKPGALAFSTIGQGSGAHLHLEWFRTRGMNMLHVPYKGGEAALNAAVSGDVQVTINATGRTLPMIKAGKVRALAVVGDQPSAFIPGLRSVVELGYDVNLGNWIGMLAPAGTPDAVVRRMNSEINLHLRDEAFAKQYVLTQGIVPTATTTEAFRDFLRKQHETYADLVKASGVKFEQ
jgi:tripartite-type tricarboxylate transporter receptor subunit TctC